MRAVFLDYDTLSRGDVAPDALEASGVSLTLHGTTRPEEVDPVPPRLGSHTP